jgi:glutamate carboxypeptidase
MLSASALRARLEGELEAMVEETTRLAAIESGSYDEAGVAAVADGLGELFAQRGFTVTREGERVTAVLERGDGPRLLVLGHADTVWPAGEAWPVTRDGDWLRGPGVGDMKACVVMAAHALGAAADEGLRGSVEVLVVPDEELGSPRSRPWIEERALAADACLGLEAGWPGGGVVVARGAVGALRVTAHGRSAHCAAHEDEGASAIAALAPLVAELEACGRPEEGVRVNVGVFRGGTARQVVPDRAELHVDLRAPGQEAADALRGRIDAVVASARGGEVELGLHGGFTRPAFAERVSAPLWELARARAEELGIPLVAERTRGGADTSFAGALGVPTLDGLGAICHDSCARGERIEISSLADRGALLAALALDLAGYARSGKVEAPA